MNHPGQPNQPSSNPTEYHWLKAGTQDTRGPASEAEIRGMIARGDLVADDMVWHAGMSDWKPISAVPTLAQLFAASQPAMQAQPGPVHMPQYAGNQPSGGPFGGPSLPDRRYTPGNFKTMLIWYAIVYAIFSFVVVVGVVISTVGIVSDEEDVLATGILVTCGSLVPWGGLLIIWGNGVYHAWRQLQDGHAYTTAGKAVGFAFIPLFVYYWRFVVYFKFFQNATAYTQRHRLGSVSNGGLAGLGLTAAIVSCVSVIAACMSIFGIPLLYISTIPAAIAFMWMMVVSARIAKARADTAGYRAA